MKQSRVFLLLSLLFSFTVLTSNLVYGQKPSGDYLTMSVLYVHSSAEYRALCYQAFNAAKTSLDTRLADERPKKPFAMIVDIDETVLDNSPYEARIVLDSIQYPTDWDQWIRMAQAKPVPGAVEFLNYADSIGVQVFYLSNRRVKNQDATMKNLKSAGFPQVTKKHMYLRTDESSKEQRRLDIGSNYTIALLIGDNLNDFKDVFEKKPSAERKSAVDQFRNKFGSQYIILPNPMYGEWEGAAYQYDWSLSPAERDSARRTHLEGYR